MRVITNRTDVSRGLTVLATALLVACSPRNEERQAASGAADTMTSGMDHTQMDAAAGGADHEFLDKMVNHHEGLILLAGRAENKSGPFRADAKKLHAKQETEQQKMLKMLSGPSGKSVEPMIMPKHKMMSDSLERQNGKAYERGFYQDVIAHHKEGIAMIDSFLPRLTDDSVRTMAEKMRSDQEKEIQEFSKKTGTS